MGQMLNVDHVVIENIFGDLSNMKIDSSVEETQASNRHHPISLPISPHRDGLRL